LEFELKRRLYNPSPNRYHLTKAGFTLGTLTTAYTRRFSDREATSNWETMLWVVKQSKSNTREFEELIKQMIAENIREKRNLLAHGETVTKEIATSLYEHIIGDRHKPGLLCWLAENLEPA
jgi:DNA topoisomerase IA